MELLKDKKKLPIVIGLAVFFLLGAGGLIAMELGAFSGGSSDETPTASKPIAAPPIPTGGPPPGAPVAAASPPARPSLPPGMRHRGRPGRATAPGTPPAAAAGTVVATAAQDTDPTKGPDPFAIPGGVKKIAASGTGSGPGLMGMRLPLRQVLPPMNLYQLRSAALLITPPSLSSTTYAQNPAANYRLAGIVNGADGNINAILEVGGQSQQVKPGDALPDGSRVLTIQTTSLTLKTGSGTTISLPLSAGNSDQTTQPGQPNLPPGYNGPPPGFVPPGYNGPPPGFVYPTGPPPGFVPPGAGGAG